MGRRSLSDDSHYFEKRIMSFSAACEAPAVFVPAASRITFRISGGLPWPFHEPIRRIQEPIHPIRTNRPFSRFVPRCGNFGKFLPDIVTRVTTMRRIALLA